MDRPVFIVGSMGSGTTLLRLILDSHPNLAIGQETGFMRAANAHYFIPFWRAGDVWLERLGLSEQDLDRHMRSFYDGVFSQFAELRGAGRWGDKTPYHIWHMEAMARIFPDAQFVGTARHPSAVANSLGRFKWGFERGVAHWVRANREMLGRGAELGDRFLLVRYEDLMTQTRDVLTEVLTFLDEPWDERVLNHHTVHAQGDRALVVEGRTRADDPIDPSRMHKWVERVSPAQRDYVGRQTGALASVLGYDPVTLDLQPPADGGPIGWGGSALGPILEASGLSFGRVPATFENSLYTPDAFAAQLRSAYEAGRNGGHVRATYRKRVEGPSRRADASKQRAALEQRTLLKPSLVRRARSRLARVISPGQP